MIKDFVGKYKNQFNYIVANLEFRFNICSGQYEYRRLMKSKVAKGSKWIKYDDRARNKILIDMFEKDLDISQDKFNIFVESEMISPEYDPFREYFDNLKPYDEKVDYIKKLSDTVKTDNQTVFEHCLRKFLVGTVECLLENDAVNDVCLVFQSGQGLGKTRWMRRLLPEKFRDEYLYEGNIDTKNKDHVMYLSQYWLIHLDELEALKGNEVSSIKSFITRQRISLRKSYGRYNSHFVRRASFLGSVNDDKFLTDITGNRRWLVSKVNQIDYEHHVDVDGVWSQAFHLYNEGFKHWFDVDEIKEINKANEGFRMMSSEEELLLQLFEFPEELIGGDWLSSTDTVLEIGKSRPLMSSKLLPVKMGKALSRYAKLKKTSNGVQKYYLILNELKKENEAKDADNQEFRSEDDDLPF